MNEHLQHILHFIEQDNNMTADEKNALLKSIKDADREFEITVFKLEQTEKAKRTTGSLLDETIEELEQKRKVVEAQNRELEIEASLERVRTIAMGMSRPEDLLNISKANYAELTKLGFSEIRNSLIGIFHDDKNCFADYDYSDFSGGSITNIPYNKNSIIDKSVQQMKSATDAFTEFIVEGTELEEWKTFRKQNGEYDDTRLKDANALYYYFYSIEQGNVGISTFKKISEEQLNILKRFRNVFDLAYKRYTDITIAEAQAREAQIQLALERVRARTMAMQKSDELSETAFLLFQQFKQLGKFPDQITIGIINEREQVIEFWLTIQGNQMNRTVKASIHEPTLMNKMYSGWVTQKKSLVVDLTGKELEDYINYRNSLSRKINAPESNDHYEGRRVINVAFFSKGFITFSSPQPCEEESIELLERFAGVFDQTYTRFLDLQKAEAQAREAQIEAALERVRSRMMAMHRSEDLPEVMKIITEQFFTLGFNVHGISFFPDKMETDMNVWIGTSAKTYPTQTFIPYFDHPNFTAWINAVNDGLDLASLQLGKEETHSWWQHFIEKSNVEHLSADRKNFLLQLVGYASSLAIMKHTGLAIINYAGVPFSDEENAILKRFGNVFEQTYTRFLDLQKAETQAREAQIELSLERVRAKTMAMHNSADVGATAAVMVEELKKLGVETIRCGIGIMHEPGDMEVWTISTDENNKTAIIIGWLDMNMHPLLHGAFESWRNKIEAYSYDLKDDDLLGYYNAINNYPGYPIRYDTSNLPKQIHHNEFHFAEGTLFAFSLQQLAAEQKKIFKRFAAVFGQTYRRYLDLKRAEAQAREAQIETALERVRSRTLAMQKSNELAETAAVLFNQLVLLGIEPNRLYIGIIKDDDSHIEFWATDEEGSKISTMFTGDTSRNVSMKKMYDAWKAEKKSLTIDMQGAELNDYFQYMADELKVPFTKGLSQKRRIQNIAFFGKGFLGIASPDEQPESTALLLERFAAVFNLTYTRFNDLKVAEAHAVQAKEDLVKLQTEKKRAEDALTELRATQTQLIQSEKMASLGELTAGIAHEIQNPLNFVNNFSEVSKELLDEMKEAINKGDTEDAKDIMNDVIQNLEKINHHGKRADAIVKGMLQHSRATSATKEPTDINKLADEYLRLAYHGLRAKDKSFNATLKTDYDESVERVNIIPQDMGRVILNLITNAFYVVAEKKKFLAQGLPTFEELATLYEPTVWVSTKKTGDKVEIKIKDNGDGIPRNILDKIFQPFFTTKPTGQGTGLGLSLAYDIVKAHGGETKVNTKENEGTEFTIILPA